MIDWIPIGIILYTVMLLLAAYIESNAYMWLVVIIGIIVGLASLATLPWVGAVFILLHLIAFWVYFFTGERSEVFGLCT